jgi:molybdenum cofactor guanylyltransferase
LDLTLRLLHALQLQNADIAVATSAGNSHPVFSLCKKSVLPSLTNFINQDGRKVSAWQKSLNYIEVDFSDNDEAFINLNTLQDLSALELKLHHA